MSYEIFLLVGGGDRASCRFGSKFRFLAFNFDILNWENFVVYFLWWWLSL